MPNALADETSPYLRQHRHNPVDWLPWGERALVHARERDQPLLVSIGYSSCHWCHVMERESFEDTEVAALMNRHFVCVKVDREERPDVDAIYMEAVQGMTGHGGWPLNVFLTPEQVPFYGGTYFPPDARHRLPSWREVLEAVADAWDQRRAEIRASGASISTSLSGASRLSPSTQAIDPRGLRGAVDALVQAHDADNGGFGGAPKFPPASVLEFLLGRAAVATQPRDTAEAQIALHTLRAMAAGGIYDQVGGGFSRYAVDATWTVPHFEKMLYDNALLARAYLHGWQLSDEPRLLEVCCQTLDWALSEMRGPEGGFYSALDADSEGVEGRYYVWSVRELRRLLGADADVAINYFGATERGNFEGENVLTGRGPRPADQQLARVRRRLAEAREERVRPGLDDKRLTAWNALMISALADAGAALNARGGGDAATSQQHAVGARYLRAASVCADFVLTRLRDDEGRLLRTHNNGQSKLAGYLEDHAFLAEALLTLYEATFEERWFVAAREIADAIIARFADPQRGGFFSTASDHEVLLTRRKDIEDAPIPAGASSATLGLLRLAALTGEQEYERQALGALALVHEIAPRHPSAFGHLLQAIDFHLAAVREIALAGPDPGPLVAVVRSRLRPHSVLAAGPGDGRPTAVALLEGRTTLEGATAAYVCERFTCLRPVTDARELAALLD